MILSSFKESNHSINSNFVSCKSIRVYLLSKYKENFLFCFNAFYFVVFFLGLEAVVFSMNFFVFLKLMQQYLTLSYHCQNQSCSFIKNSIGNIFFLAK